MKIARLQSENKECAICRNKATSIVQNGHILRQYYLCDQHTENIVYPVRVIDVLKLKPKKTLSYTPIRFLFSFKGVAVKENGELVLLSNYSINTKNRTIVPDHRSAAEYLLDNPPYNLSGCKYQVSRKKRRVLTDRCNAISISNSAYADYHSTTTLEDLYKKLSAKKASWLLPYNNSLKKVVVSHKECV